MKFLIRRSNYDGKAKALRRNKEDTVDMEALFIVGIKY
jgi:hypothetical protein